MRRRARWAAAAALTVSGPLVVGAATAARAATTPGCPRATGERITNTPATFPRTVALTFDDGPSPVWTPQVLQILARHHVHATFFVVGRRVAAAPEVLQQVIAAGHVIGNHTWDHPTLGNGMYGLTPRQLADELDSTTAMIRDSTGLPVCFFRAPQGKDHTPTIRRLAKARGLVVAGFHTASDYQQPNRLDPAWVNRIEQRLENLGPHPVILLHDGGVFRGNSVAALEQIITWYASRGYVFTDPAGRPFPGDTAPAGVPRSGWAIPPGWTPPATSPVNPPSSSLAAGESTPDEQGAQALTATTGAGALPSSAGGTDPVVTPSDLPSPETFAPESPATSPATGVPPAAPLAALARKGKHDPLAARTVMDAVTRYLMVFSSPPA